MKSLRTHKKVIIFHFIYISPYENGAVAINLQRVTGNLKISENLKTKSDALYAFCFGENTFYSEDIRV